MLQKVIKTGNSLAVTIPAEFARNIGVKHGQEVKTNFDITTGVLKFTFPSASQLPLLCAR